MNSVASKSNGFTLLELIVVIAIGAMLVTMIAPAIGRISDRAKSTQCGANLRAIGASVHLFAQDNDNRIPTIEGFPSDPYYDGPMAEEAQTLVEALGPYGVTKDTLKCPVDRGNYFEQEGTSYLWKPTLDNELVSNPKLYGRRGVRVIPPQYASICTDFDRGHGPGQKRSNRLYLDGHVRVYY